MPRAFPLTLPAALALALGCSGRPLPTTVQAGSTFALALAGEVGAGGNAGYGGELLAARGLHDDQRGTLRFALRDPATGAEHALATRLVTRAHPDPASEVGLQNRVDALTAGFGIAQLLAVIDVPASVPPGEYEVQVRRERRTDAGGVEALPAPVYGQRVTVLPAQVGNARGEPTPSSAFLGSVSSDVSAQLAALVPHPKVVLSLPTPPPHAARIVLSYPAAKVRLRGVIEEQHGGRGSIVAWRDDPAAGRVTIDFVDPAASVKALALVFEPKGPLSTGRIALSDLGVSSATLYDASGAVRAGSVLASAIR